MSRTTERWTSRLALGCLVVALAALLSLQQPPAQGQPNADPTKYDYNVVSVESNALQAKLTELGNQGWDLVVITTSEARVDGANNPPKVVTEKYDVTCRKVRK